MTNKKVIFSFFAIINALPFYDEEEIESYCMEADLQPETTDFEVCIDDMKRELNK